MKDIDADVISKIQKLLNLSDTNRNSNIGEAESALAMAHKLLSKHHLSMSQIMALDESGSTNSGFFELNELEVCNYVANILPLWLKNLIETINMVTDTRALIKRSPRPGSSYGTLKIVFVGDVVDVTTAKNLFDFLKETVSSLSSSHAKKFDGKFKHWRSFAEGCSTALSNKAARLLAKNKEPESIIEDPADRLSVDNFLVDEDLEGEEEDDGIEDEDDDLDEEDNDSEINIEDPGCSIELYKKYQDTKFEKIKEYIEQLDVEDETTTSKSKRVDVDSFSVGHIAGEKIPLKVVTKLKSHKSKK